MRFLLISQMYRVSFVIKIHKSKRMRRLPRVESCGRCERIAHPDSRTKVCVMSQPNVSVYSKPNFTTHRALKQTAQTFSPVIFTETLWSKCKCLTNFRFLIWVSLEKVQFYFGHERFPHHKTLLWFWIDETGKDCSGRKTFPLKLLVWVEDKLSDWLTLNAFSGLVKNRNVKSCKHRLTMSTDVLSFINQTTRWIVCSSLGGFSGRWGMGDWGANVYICQQPFLFDGRVKNRAKHFSLSPSAHLAIRKQ